MKQILQNLSNGETTLIEAPAPTNKSGHCLIETSTSLISAGTEKMLVSFGQSNLFDKARQQPEKVKQVLDKVRTDGLASTIDAVRSKLSEPLPLGYCNVGKVVSVGANVDNVLVGDRVVSNGAHADIVRVAKNLCAKIPDNVDDESAAFTVLASIGLQGIRLAQPTMGESFAVIGAGLIGLCAIQLLKANGCHVLAIDYDTERLALAKSFGAEICNPAKGEDPVVAGFAFSSGKGIDGVLITASTQSSDPISQAARMSRQRGRIILIGVTGLELNRAEFYEKELSFQVSCSYGPGRYDENYEQKGNDYPLGFVRWTEQRNFEAILSLLSSGTLNFKPLISHRFAFSNATNAYTSLTHDASALGIVLQYENNNLKEKLSHKQTINQEKYFDLKQPVLGFIGAGNYASRILIPAFKSAGAQLHSITTSGGLSGAIQGRKYNFKDALSDVESLLNHSDINTVVVATQHNTHADFVCQALAANKHVFVEKPLAINFEQLNNVKKAYVASKGSLMIGFNRRFSPQVQTIKNLLSVIKEPKSFIMTINAGELPSNHWTQKNEVGGGRIIGEACHFIDLMRFLAGSPIESVQAIAMGKHKSISINEDKAVISLRFEDGSFGTIHYLANGGSRFPKERIEVFAANGVLQLDNFRKLKGFSWKGFNKMNLWKQDKGQKACVQTYIDAMNKGQPSPISAEEIFEVSQVSIEVAEQIRAQV